MNTHLLACNSNSVYIDVSGLNNMMNTQLLAFNSNITYADAAELNYKMNTQLLACNWQITSWTTMYNVQADLQGEYPTIARIN